jgi:hypothetical protein
MKIDNFLIFSLSEDKKWEPLDSFYIKNELNPEIWDDFKLKDDIKEDLKNIALDFWEWCELDIELDDIIVTGSLANYNWSEYSDWDIHLLVDYKKINKDYDLVEKLTDLLRKEWNSNHDIKVSGYEVEVFIQDTKADHVSTGFYSLLNDEWVVKPEKKKFKPNIEEIKLKSKPIIEKIDDLEDFIETKNYSEFKEELSKVWKKIKKMRKSGLEEGEFGLGNLVFKLLRRNGYISKIMDMKRRSYDKQFK